jgi:hypothetical protein
MSSKAGERGLRLVTAESVPPAGSLAVPVARLVEERKRGFRESDREKEASELRIEGTWSEYLRFLAVAGTIAVGVFAGPVLLLVAWALPGAVIGWLAGRLPF